MTSALPDILIRASAGTGKTYQLASRFLQLLEADVPPESILAATFTRKAAGEILERILLMLARAATDDRKRAELANAIESPGLTAARCQQLLVKLTRRLHRLQVGTLDSFFAKLASSFSLDLGLPPGWRILEGVEADRLREDAVEALLEAENDDDLVRLLRLLTKGTTSRSVSELIVETVRKCHEIALQTPPEAWRKVPQPSFPNAGDLHQSVQALQELKQAATRTDKPFLDAIDNDIELADRELWEEMLTKGLLKKLLEGELKFNRKELDPTTLAVYQTLLGQISSIALNRLARQTEATRDLLDKYDCELHELQRRHGGCSFSDVARALAGGRESQRDDQQSLGKLAFRMDSRLSHLLLDEFQDTSPLQWSVLRPFAEQVVSKQRPKKKAAQGTLFDQSELPPSFFCVGDVKQAIYGWRGGDARIFDTLRRQLPNVTPQDLALSRRSAQPIIDTVNRVFQNLQKHPRLDKLAGPVDSWCRQFPPHSTARTDLDGFVQFRVVPKVSADDNESQDDITLRAAARLIAELATKHSQREIGVLTRSNEAVAQLIFELQQLGVPASEEGGHPLTDSAAVRLLLSLLKLADHPGDRIARFHVATSPLGAAFKFEDFRDDSAAARLAESLRRSLLSDGYGPCIAVWSKLLFDHGSPRDRARLNQLIKLADAYSAAGGSATLRPTDFAEFVREERVADPSGDRIRVMTVHQAKGLQFDIVVLPELDHQIPGQSPDLVAGNVDPAEPPDAVCLYRSESIQQLLPSELQQLFEQDTERRTHESLCLLYVALTRAVHAMYLLIAPHDKEPKKSFAGLLRASLTTDMLAPADAVLFETGNPDWDVRRLGLCPDRVGTESQPTNRIRFALPLPTPSRGWQREAPSSHESLSTRRLNELLRPHTQDALDRGTLIHKWFEQIEWLDTGRPSHEQLFAATRTLPPLTTEPNDVLPEFFTFLDKPAIAAVLSRTNSPHRSLTPRVLREHPFACRFDRTLISGIIDRLVLWSSGSEIVAAELLDFKTDAVDDQPSLSARVDTYRPQLDSYRRAVAQLFHLDANEVSATLVFVQPGEIVRL
ncbi:MAG: UvrD-helicase domain-containing protein [Planctomycetaceae bacterium]|nr:UvrD-helicase domain-containing protein [Planctomycetaceae bacterium]